MKLSIERNTLLKAVSHAQSVVERRNTIPILANVLIEAENDKVQFRATDLDVEVVDRVQLKLIVLAQRQFQLFCCMKLLANCPMAH